MIKLVVGLGNPGREHEFNRHNIGWLAMDQLSFYDSLNWQKKFKGQYADYNLNGQKVYFLKPDTYMNLSGESVIKISQFFKILPEEILVVHDELDLAFGEVNLKSAGGFAGHNGLKSIGEVLGVNTFKRLRLGIGRPAHGNVASYVLSNFSQDEEQHVEIYFSKSAKIIEDCIAFGFQKSANQNSKKKLLI